ncbi:MAG TPA: RnfABCDGE type electron transport complex subunit D [Treponemataceae bacterium]|nr:RnfABCDGE type electron transport complex subunit D [Treponemataceae bacterium]
MKNNSWIVSPSPFILTRTTVSKMTIILLCTLVPQLGMLAITGDTKALLNILLTVLGSVIAQGLFSLPMHKSFFADEMVFISGILTGLLLPVDINLFVAFASSFAGMSIARILFGGTGFNWMNATAVAVAIAWISHPESFPSFVVSSEGVRTVGSFFGALKLDHFNMISLDQSITTALNSGFLTKFGIKLPEGYITLFWISPSTIPAFRYNFLILLSSIILLSFKIIDWIIPTVFIVTYSILIRLFSLVPFDIGFFQGDILFALLTGGILFVAFYMAGDYSTSPRTRSGKIISGFFSGIVCFFVCGPGGAPVGAIFTILIINVINPFIECVERYYYKVSGDFS